MLKQKKTHLLFSTLTVATLFLPVSLLAAVATTTEVSPVVNSLQPEPKDKKLLPEQRLDDRSYRYFTAKPFVERTGPVNVRHAIMSGMHREAHPFYPLYFNGSKMPRPDILELRTPLYAFYDARTGLPNDFILQALQAANAAGIPQIEVSPFGTGFSAHDTNPEVATDINHFYRMYFKEQLPELMVDASGRPSNAVTDTSEVRANRCCYSYYDPANREFVLKTVAEITTMLRKHKELRTAGINVRFPSNNDWYYPINHEFYDYSVASQNAFREFLREKYGTVKKLNTIYGTSYADFAAIAAPPPPVGRLDLSHLWQDWQEFRIVTVYRLQRELFTVIRRNDPDREIVSWMTTAVSAAARDGIVLDYAMRLTREFPRTLLTLTCFDYFDLPGELFGQLAIAYQVPIAIEPLHNDPRSYQKTFFNVLRFPVKKANWLFYIAADPASMPWITWVMNQRGVVDELADAKLIQADTIQLFSYSDAILQVPEKLYGQKYIKSSLVLFQALQRSNLNLPMITDYSLPVKLEQYRNILIADAKLIRPEMIAKIGAFVHAGGQATLVGMAGEYDLNTGKADYPLLRELGIDARTIKQVNGNLRLTHLPHHGTGQVGPDGQFAEAIWPCGRGKVIFRGNGVASLIGQDGNFNMQGQRLVRDLELAAPVKIENPGWAGSFVKGQGLIRYLGFINLTGGAFRTTAEFTPATEFSELDGVELLAGERIIMKNGKFTLNFELPWQIKVIKITLSNKHGVSP